MNRTVLVCCGTGCIANGAMETAKALRAALSEADPPVCVETVLKQTGCNGLCEKGPVVRIMPDDISYYKVRPKDAPAIAASIGGKPVERLLYRDDGGKTLKRQDEIPFYNLQNKVALRNVGLIDPMELSDFFERGGYTALRKALGMTPDEIIREVELSGLRGRGGAGFPTGRKWRTAAGYDAAPKYVVCNGDEGDPGAFMDCSLLKGDPHSVLEGMAICALAIEADEGFLYIRDEYALARKRIQKAIVDAESAGILGPSMMGSGKSLKLRVVRGGGAFVCGESTALMASIEGRVGEPRAKYVRSVQRGLWNQPTVLNNVETFANIPVIINNGGAKFAETGSDNSKGTKVFAMVGKVKQSGLVEVPMGVTLRHLVYDIGGGVIGDRPFKAVQTGGPSGGCIPAELLDLPVDFDTLTKYGGMMGSGGMIVMDDRNCMVEVARYYVNFLAGESCGKCTPCREGLRQMLSILTDICDGRGRDGDIDLLEEIGETMMGASLCALGKSAPNPVLTTIRYFRDEYDAHIKEGRCPAGICPALTAFEIDAQTCAGCALCKRACPAGAITGEIKSPRVINQEICISCGSCREACRFGAVRTAPKRGAAV